VVLWSNCYAQSVSEALTDCSNSCDEAEFSWGEFVVTSTARRQYSDSTKTSQAHHERRKIENEQTKKTQKRNLANSAFVTQGTKGIRNRQQQSFIKTSSGEAPHCLFVFYDLAIASARPKDSFGSKVGSITMISDQHA
jgi:hypothetical protein